MYYTRTHACMHTALVFQIFGDHTYIMIRKNLPPESLPYSFQKDARYIQCIMSHRHDITHQAFDDHALSTE